MPTCTTTNRCRSPTSGITRGLPTETSTISLMHLEIRRYKIQSGHLDDFVSAWRQGVVPLREEYGFTFHGAWAVDETDEFVWILGHTDEQSFESANRRYYDSPARTSLDPDPAVYITEVSESPARPVLQDDS